MQARIWFDHGVLGGAGGCRSTTRLSYLAERNRLVGTGFPSCFGDMVMMECQRRFSEGNA